MPSINDARAIFAAAKTAMRAEDREKIAMLANAYFDCVDENFTLREKNAELAREIEDLRSRLSRKESLVRLGAAYYVQDGEDATGPVCPGCYEAKGEVVLLERGERGAKCPNCKSRYPGVKASVPGPRQKML